VEFRAAVAATLRAERAAARMTTQRLAELSGVSRATIVRLETGSRHGDLDQFYKIAAALGMTGSELLRKAEDRQQSGEPPSNARAVADKAAAARIAERLDNRERDGYEFGRITEAESRSCKP
jgi:transcriptional regulator with XRE-family HTH domain